MIFLKNKNLLLLSILITFQLFNISAQSNIKVVLLGGQSNMAGRGVYSNLSDEDKQRIEQVKGRVLVVSQSKEATPLSYSKADKRKKEFGPELFIGVTLAEQFPNDTFLFIKTAVGGTSLHGAWSPDWTQEKAIASERGEARQKMKLYHDHIKSIHANLTQLEQEGKSYDIIGMAWMQGEKDTRLELSASEYESNLKRLIQAYEIEFKIENMPFVFGQINNPSRTKDYQKGVQVVRSAMTNVANSSDFIQMIPTSKDTTWSDYPKHEDNVHYNCEGQKRLGSDMGKALIQLITLP
ncbi:sialate O-acetylesterase [Saccharicrinis aurantiacus]|uniref:sialate O-acetylesterase n=1 Tax=Saccharicrinis aurantiacus TaxID=1849719 RepID=UPI000950108B|nr:sialate O-acetylesterase [Saccharicrinis aurantiacus]